MLFLNRRVRSAFLTGVALCALTGMLSGCGGRSYKALTKAQQKLVEQALDVSQVVSAEDELKALRKTVEANPESSAAAEAQFRIGVLNEKRVKGAGGQTGDRDGALTAYESVQENYADSPYVTAASYRRGELLWDSEDPQERKDAIKCYEAILGYALRSGRGKQKGPEPTVPEEGADGKVKWVPAKEILPEKLDKLYQDRLSYQLLSALVAVSAKLWPGGAYGLAIILLTILVKLLVTPLTRKQFESMKDMQKLQPEVKKLQERHKGDPQKLNKEVMDLYRQHGVNPLGGCLPMLIQMPVLIWLYRAIMAFRLQFDGQGFLWVKNLAHPDMPLLVMYLISMIISQRLTTTPTADPQQQQTQKTMAIMMPIMFAFMFQTFPSAFILYWLMFNVLSTAQQLHIMRGSGNEQDKKLGIKTLIPSLLSIEPKPKTKDSAVTPPRDLDTTEEQGNRGAGKSSKRKRKRRKK